MKYVVEVAHLVGGDLVSARTLSARRERLGALSAVMVVCFVTTIAMVVGTVCARLLGRALYAPSFIALWGAMAVVASVLAAAAVRRRLRRYVLGVRLDADAFSAIDADLVRRRADRFELTVIPGMEGHVESGRAPIPIEALVTNRPRKLTLDEGATVELSLGASTFVVRSRVGTDPARIGVSREQFNLFSRILVAGVQVALIGSVLCVVPSGQTIGDRAAHLVAPRITTPWEAEKWLRIEAQAQARSLHQCFDPLPVACQHSGYVGVGVSLTRDGDVRSNWIARSTYGSDCPVDGCIKDVVSTWVFDPLPETMRVVLPVQVLRTEKPLPTKVADARLEPGEDVPAPWSRGR
jgi:hypothetical protein